MNYLYTRVSTIGQGVDSLDTQKDICLNILNNWGITINGFYSEVDSGYKGNQRVLNNAIDNISNCNIYVLNVSRFCRNSVKGQEMISKATSKDINIHFIEENYNTSNSTHAHAIRVKLSEAQLESENTSKRITNRNNIMKKNGWKFGKCPYGYSVTKVNKTRKFVKNVHETNVINFIVQARNGTSCNLLNRKLKKIDNKAPVIVFYDKDGTKIEHFKKKNTLNFSEIADLLNDYYIDKRGKSWTSNNVSSVFNSNNKVRLELNKLSLA